MNLTLAIPFAEGSIFQHFGKTTQFKIYKIEEDKIVSSSVVDTEGTGHEDIALWLVWHGVNAVVCGNIGPGAQGALAAAGIPFLAGVTGSADDAAAALVAGTLQGSATATCGGHGGGGGCSGHCGHGCGGCHHGA